MTLSLNLEPGKAVAVKLLKAGYLTETFQYTVPSAAATVTKTMLVELYEAKIISATLNKASYAPGETITLTGSVKNTGNVLTDIIGKIYLDGVLGLTKNLTNVAVGATTTVSGTAPAPLPGSHVIKITVEPKGKTITDTRELPFTVVAPTGTLSVTTTPTGAKAGVVPLGGGPGISCIATPCTFPPLAPGDYTLTVEKAGYETITDTVTIIAGVTTTKSYTLTPSKGTLSITTSPTGATVKVGTETKTSPCNFSLAPGTYIVTVSKSGYDTITDSITITAGETTTKSYTLTRSEVTITFDTKKEDGTTLTGVDVWIDGTKRGVT